VTEATVTVTAWCSDEEVLVMFLLSWKFPAALVIAVEFCCFSDNKNSCGCCCITVAAISTSYVLIDVEVTLSVAVAEIMCCMLLV
jgi:hypothetical protein